jgi:MFS family permease
MPVSNERSLTPAVSISGNTTSGRTHVGTLAAACIAVFIAQLANAMPISLNGVFQQSLHTTGSELTWIAAAFMVTVVVFEFTFGVLGDLFGRRRLVTAGALVLAVGAVVCALAPNVATLWVGSAINGLGAGAMYPGTLALIAAASPTPAVRARSIALWSGCIGGATAAAPAIGAVITTETGNWHIAFWVLAGLAVAAAVVTRVLSAESAAPQGRGLDIHGQITFAASLLLLMIAVIQGSSAGWGKPYVVWSFVVAGVLLTAFVMIEARSKTPILQIGLFRNRAFAVASLVTVLGMFGFLSAGFATSIWISAVQHQAPLKVALAFLFLAGPPFFLAPAVSRALRSVSPAIMLASGFTLMGAGSLLCLRLDVRDLSLLNFVLPDILIGIGFALSVASLTAVAINTVPLHLAGMASATTNMLRDFGFALGPIITGSVALSSAGSRMLAGLGPVAARLPAGQASKLMGLAHGGGPLAVASVLPAGSPPQLIAVAALGSGFHLAWLVAGTACLTAAVITIAGLYGVKHAGEPTAESLADPLNREPA